jgi:hypothetical protein
MTSKKTNAILTLAALMVALGLVSFNHDRLAKARSVERQSQATDEKGHAVDAASASLALTPEPANPQFD